MQRSVFAAICISTYFLRNEYDTNIALKFFLSIITESINKLTEFLERHPAVKNNWKSGMTDLEDLR